MSAKLFAVFGKPILHSRSPQLFNAAFEEYGIDAYYTRIRPHSAKDIIEIIRTMPLAGANITAPYKEEMITLVDVVSLDAENIGAINTIVNSDGRLIGYNTDHYGIIQSLKEAGIDLANTNCLVLGGGGAARSAVYGLKQKGAQVTICNRTESKAQTIANDLGCAVMSWERFDASNCFDVVVSTLLPTAFPPFFVKLKFSTLLDASYKQSKISEMAQKSGIKIISGKRWLLHQAIESFRLYFGDQPPIHVMEGAMENLLKKESLIVKELSNESQKDEYFKNANLIVSSREIEKEKVKVIIDEEISKAFGS